jgi:hypothetical protein
MFGYTFYNETTRRYVAVFGTLFNSIKITRKDLDSNTIQTMTVPVNYGPMQKFLSRIEQDPDLTAPAITLPRITFEITGMTYDGERNLTSSKRISKANATNDANFNTIFTPTPYNLSFQLNIMTKYQEDGTKILEQIIPFFKPDFTPTVKLVDTLDEYFDIPIILESISTEDTYDSDYTTRRTLIWTLNFTLKGYYFGPVTQKKVIKFVEIDMYGDITANTALETITVRPGLLANGSPTTVLSQTIPYANINFDDDWAYIVQIEDYVE